MVIRTSLLNKTNIIGVAWYPFIFVRPDATVYTINHEKIHIRQQLELGVLPFFIMYLIDYVVKKSKYGNRAYMNMYFEVEAYLYESDLTYLECRSIWGWKDFL